FAVEVEHALAEVVAAELGDGEQDVHLARLPAVVGEEVRGRILEPGRKMLRMEHAEHGLLAEILPVAPRGISRVAGIAVEIDVLSEDALGTLRAAQASHALELREVQPGVVGPAGIDIADVREARAFQVERLVERAEHLAIANAFGRCPRRLRVDVKATRVKDAAE